MITLPHSIPTSPEVICPSRQRPHPHMRLSHAPVSICSAAQYPPFFNGYKLCPGLILNFFGVKNLEKKWIFSPTSHRPNMLATVLFGQATAVPTKSYHYLLCCVKKNQLVTSFCKAKCKQRLEFHDTHADHISVNPVLLILNFHSEKHRSHNKSKHLNIRAVADVKRTVKNRTKQQI